MRSLSIHSEAENIPHLCNTQACVLIPLYYYHFEFLRIKSRHYDEKKNNQRFKWVLDCKRSKSPTNQGKKQSRRPRYLTKKIPKRKENPTPPHSSSTHRNRFKILQIQTRPAPSSSPSTPSRRPSHPSRASAPSAPARSTPPPTTGPPLRGVGAGDGGMGGMELLDVIVGVVGSVGVI